MNDLELETLLRHARATGPRPGSKERLRGRILAAASGGALAIATSQTAAAAAAGTGAVVAGAGKAGSLGLGIVLCLAAGAAVGTAVSLPVVLRSQKPNSGLVEPAAPALPRGHVAQASSARRVETEAAPVVSVAPEPSAPAQALPGRAAPSAELAPSIQRETALLAQAQRALQRGEFALTLVWLDRHEREFPAGALAEEALCARVVAACSLGQEAGRIAAKTFARLYPNSPLLPRVSSACKNPDPP